MQERRQNISDSCLSDSRITFYSPASATPERWIESPHLRSTKILNLKVCERSGDIYVTCLNRDTVYVFSTDGELLRSIGSGLHSPTAVALTANGLVLISEYDDCCLSVWTCEGVFVCRWPLHIWQRKHPIDVVVLPFGKVVVSYSSLNVF